MTPAQAGRKPRSAHYISGHGHEGTYGAKGLSAMSLAKMALEKKKS